jgi:hypothetical protein
MISERDITTRVVLKFLGPEIMKSSERCCNEKAKDTMF